jgi:hypothetical protein
MKMIKNCFKQSRDKHINDTKWHAELAIREIYKGRMEMGRAVYQFGRALKTVCRMDPLVRVVGVDSAAIKYLTGVAHMDPWELRLICKVYYHYFALPNPRAIRFDMDYICTMDTVLLVRFIPLMLQHYRNPHSGIGARVRLRKDAIQLNQSRDMAQDAWKSPSDYYFFADFLKVKDEVPSHLDSKSNESELGDPPIVFDSPDEKNRHIRPQNDLFCSSTLRTNTDYVVDRLLISLRLWEDEDIDEPLEDLDQYYCLETE